MNNFQDITFRQHRCTVSIARNDIAIAFDNDPRRA